MLLVTRRLDKFVNVHDGEFIMMRDGAKATFCKRS